MSDCRLEIVPCDYKDFPCSSFVCNNAGGHDKYYLGNKYSGGIHNYEIYCSECVKHLVAHIPSELSADGGAVEQRIRAELTAEYNAILAQKVADFEHATRIEAEKFIAYKLAEAESPFGVEEVEELTPVESVPEQKFFRCLDCGADFDNHDDLNAHKAEHVQAAAPAKNKGGRPPKKQ